MALPHDIPVKKKVQAHVHVLDIASPHWARSIGNSTQLIIKQTIYDK